MRSTIEIDDRCIDGAHFFTSRHPLALGLCVASADPKAAYEEVAVQLGTLLRKNHGLSGAVAPRTPYATFYGWLTSRVASAGDGIVPLSAATVAWQVGKDGSAG